MLWPLTDGVSRLSPINSIDGRPEEVLRLHYLSLPRCATVTQLTLLFILDSSPVGETKAKDCDWTIASGWCIKWRKPPVHRKLRSYESPTGNLIMWATFGSICCMFMLIRGERDSCKHAESINSVLASFCMRTAQKMHNWESGFDVVKRKVMLSGSSNPPEHQHNCAISFAALSGRGLHFSLSSRFEFYFCLLF